MARFQDSNVVFFWDEIIEECSKLKKVDAAIKGLEEISRKLFELGCPQYLLDKMEAMLEDWKKLYWHGNLNKVNFDEILVKLKGIKEQNK
jgi:hypothetical protein